MRYKNNRLKMKQIMSNYRRKYVENKEFRGYELKDYELEER